MALSTDDRLAIHELYARYNHAIDSGDSEAWAGCFTADGVFESGRGSFRGSEQLIAFAQGFAERTKARHWTNNLILDETPEGVAGKCYLMLYRLGEGAPDIMASGLYHDTLTQAPEGWRFVSRTVITDV